MFDNAACERAIHRDAHIPLTDEVFKSPIDGSMPERPALKRTLIEALHAVYPSLDFPMLIAVVEHYLEHPRDTPDQLLERAPKDMFDESKANMTPVENPASGPQHLTEATILEEVDQEEDREETSTQEEEDDVDSARLSERPSDSSGGRRTDGTATPGDE